MAQRPVFYATTLARGAGASRVQWAALRRGRAFVSGPGRPVRILRHGQVGVVSLA